MDNKPIKNEEMKQQWLKKHKRALIIGGVVVVGTTTAAVITYVLLRKKMVSTAKIVDVAVSGLSIEPIIPTSEIPGQLVKRARPTSPVSVSSGLRKLHQVWNASETQLELAESLGIIVPDGYTFVQEYTKYKNLPDCA